MQRLSTLVYHLLVLSALGSGTLAAQNPNRDCETAIVICSDSSFIFDPGGGIPSFPDFANPNNDQGCLETGESLFGHGWFWFRFRDDMPPNSIIILDIVPLGGGLEDYDFAIYGPDLQCDSLGTPLRCSFGRVESICDTCGLTGLGNGATEISENNLGDGYVSAIVVQPGQSFYMFLDHWFDQAGPDMGFAFDWGGSAAPFLNCLTDPSCIDFSLAARDTVRVCPGTTSVNLSSNEDLVEPGTDYVWSGPAAGLLNRTDSLHVTLDLSGGQTTFELELTAQRGVCTGSTPVVVVVAAPPQIQISDPTERCPGQAVTLTAAPGNGAQGYLWSTGATTESISVDQNGPYTLTATYAGGCQTSATVTVQERTVGQLSVAGDRQFCGGSQTTIQLSGPFEIYQWADGPAGVQRTFSQAGAYAVTAFDAAGCRRDTIVALEALPLPSPVISAPENACVGQPFLVTATEGFESYGWSNGVLASSFVSPDPGTFSLLVTDENGCIGQTSVTIGLFPDNPPDLDPEFAFCPTGSVAISLNNGPYAAYSWSDGNNQGTTFSNTPGPLTVDVVDFNGCVYQAATEVRRHLTVAPDLGPDQGFCPGDTIMLTAPPGYTNYEWMSGETTQVISVSTPGNYSLLATHDNGCQVTAEVDIEAYPEPQVFIGGSTDLCPDASVTLTALPNFPQFNWSTGEQTKIIEVAEAGTYLLDVVDQNGCTADTSITIIARPAPQPVISGEAEFCADETRTFSLAGTFTTVLWQDGSTGNQITATDSGWVSVQVTNQFGCRAGDSILVAPQPLPSGQISGDNAICEGESGLFTLSGTYDSWMWNDGSFESTYATDIAGPVTVDLFTDFGCTATLATSLAIFEPPVAEAGGQQNLTCRNPQVLIGPAAQPGLTYDWTGPDAFASDQAQFTTTLPGWYYLQSTDTLSQCVSNVDSVQIQDLQFEPQVAVSFSDTIDCINQFSLLTAVVDQPGYQYTWRDLTGEIIGAGTNLPVQGSGSYTLTVEDPATGCNASDIIEVPVDSVAPVFSLSPPQPLDCRNDTRTLSVMQQDGEWSYVWTNLNGTTVAQDTNRFAATLPGTYTVTARHPASGCPAVRTVVLGVDRVAPPLSASVSTDLTCLGGPAQITAQLPDSPDNLSFSWLDEAAAILTSDPVMTTERSGTYTARLENPANGCITTLPIRLDPPADAPFGWMIDRMDPVCAGDTDGLIEINGLRGGTPPYTYSLNGGTPSPEAVFMDLATGNYSLAVTDSRGCRIDTLLSLAAGNFIRVDAGPDQIILLGQPVTLGAQVTDDGQPIRSIDWHQVPDSSRTCPGCTDWTIDSLFTTQDFSVRVTDQQGCTAQDVVRVVVQRDPRVYIPTVFSPNEDDVNDFWMPFGGPSVSAVSEMQIFDRWGGMAFRLEAPIEGRGGNDRRGWDGNTDGKPANIGVYIYQVWIEFIDGSREYYKGDLTLVR